MNTNNENTKNDLKITTPKNPMCLDIIDTSSPTSNISLSPIAMNENDKITMFKKTHYYNASELTEFEIVGDWFKNVIVDELDMKNYNKSKTK
jgi:hypothetical protein